MAEQDSLPMYIKKRPLDFDPNHILEAEDQFLVMSDPVELKIAMDEFNFRFTSEMRSNIDTNIDARQIRSF